MASATVSGTIQCQNPVLHHLSILLLADDERLAREKTLMWFAQQNRAACAGILDLAQKHHVVMRALGRLAQVALQEQYGEVGDWVANTIMLEQERSTRALGFLHSICETLRTTGRVVVIKSLDHWPDLGSDLDLFLVADHAAVVDTMKREFRAEVLERSWGDRLAQKWNFHVPGLPESVEAHIGRLGQTGEHVGLGRRVAEHAISRRIAGLDFNVPAPADSIQLATLQRMYRHFYFRLCDMVNTARLVEVCGVDFEYLRRSAEAAGIWPGTASYLQIASDYLLSYRGTGLQLPGFIRQAAQFGGEELSCDGDFLRIPILRRAARLFTMQVSSAAFRGDVPAVFRLSLLPCLGAAAAIEYRVTGSDKGIW